MTTITFLGTGDAFGSGGRAQSAMLLEYDGGEDAHYRVLLDCGASTLPSLRAKDLHGNDIDAVLLSHFHGDHTVGLPFLLLENAFGQVRQRPLLIIGPSGVAERMKQLMEASFPGIHLEELPFPIQFQEAGKDAMELGPLHARWYPVDHAIASKPHGIRVETPDGILAYSGDSAWTKQLIPLAQGADLLVCECFGYHSEVPGHMTHQQLLKHQYKLGAKRIICTHLGEEALAHRDDFVFKVADDGMQVRL